MRRWTKKLSSVMEKLLLLGFGAQILLGLLWALSHLGSFQEFRDSYFLLQVSKTLICDEYTGILYPLLIRIFQGIARVIPIPYFCLLYFLQLAVAAWASYDFFGAFRFWKNASPAKKTWAVLALLTLPMALQCHLAVLPISLASSFLLSELGWMMRVFRGEDPLLASMVRMGALSLVAGLCLPEYRLFSAIPLVFGALFVILMKGRESEEAYKDRLSLLIRVLLVVAIFLGLGNQLGRWTTKEGAYGRMQKTVEAAAFKRFGWDDFGEFYSDWPEDFVDALTQEDIAVCNRYPLRKEWVLGEKVDGVLGRERAREIYGQLARVTGRARFSRNIREIIKDMISYSFAPPTQIYLMTGKGQITLSGRNYDIMRAKSPILTAYYVYYSYLWFGIAVIVSALTGLCRFVEIKGACKWVYLRCGAVFALCALVLVVYYTMQGGGIMDYKNSLPVTALWAAWACGIALTRNGGQKSDTLELEDSDCQK